MNQDGQGEALPQISILNDIAADLASVRDEETLAWVMERSVERLVRVDYSGLFFYDPELDRLRMIYAKGFSDDERREAERTAMDRHPGWVFRNRTPLHIPDVENDTLRRSTSASPRIHVRSRLHVPVLYRDECVGVFGLGNVTPNYFTEAHMAVLGFVSNLAGVVYANLRHLRDLRAQLDLIRSQKAEILKLGAPLLTVARDVLLLPLIGRLSGERATHVQSVLLQAVTERAARVVIVDLTGAAVDAASIEALSAMAGGVRLMGARCLVSGITVATAIAIEGASVRLPCVEVFATVDRALAAALS